MKTAKPTLWYVESDGGCSLEAAETAERAAELTCRDLAARARGSWEFSDGSPVTADYFIETVYVRAATWEDLDWMHGMGLRRPERGVIRLTDETFGEEPE